VLRQTTGRDAEFFERTPKRCARVTDSRSCGALQQTRSNRATRRTFLHDLLTRLRNFCVLGRARHSVRAAWVWNERPGRGIARLPFCVYTMSNGPLRCSHGFARPRKAASHNSTMGGRGQLVFHHDQLCVSRQKPIVPCRHWQCRARRHEIQPREIRLALPVVPAYARSSACDHCLSARPGNGNDGEELEKVRRRKARRGLATRFFRSPLSRSPRTGRENQLHPDESGSKGLCQRAEDWVWVYRPNDRPPPRW
jgi:hypothetical protein